MKKLLIPVIWLISTNSFAGAYIEAGAFYLDQRYHRYIDDFNDNGQIISSKLIESGNRVAHLAIGYEIPLESININIQLKHQSDPASEKSNDLVSNNAFGVIVRKTLD